MSLYSRDPRVPPAKVEHLGKHHRSATHAPVGLPAASARDDGPTYEDFLGDGTVSDETEAPGQTG